MATVRAVIERVVNGDDLAAVDELYAPDVVLHVSGSPEPLRGTGAIRAVARAFRTGFPDWRNDVGRLVVVADGDYVATRWYEAGTHRGDFQGMAPTGRRVALAGNDLFRLRDGRIEEQWLECDLAGFRAALVAQSAPAGKASAEGDLGQFMRRMKQEIINARDPEAAGRFYAPAFATLNPLPGRAPGLAGLKQALREFLAAFPDIEETVEDTVEDGRKVAAVSTVRATHRGAFAGIPATGRRVQFHIVELHHLADDGKVREGWVFFDLASLLGQIGPAPGSR